MRTVVALFADGSVMVPVSAYAGLNSAIPVDALTTGEFRARADRLFGVSGSEQLARTPPGWLARERVSALMGFCLQVAEAHAAIGPRPERSRDRRPQRVASGGAARTPLPGEGDLLDCCAWGVPPLPNTA